MRLRHCNRAGWVSASAVGSADGSLRLYTLPEGRRLAKWRDAHEVEINRLVFDAEARIAGLGQS